MYIFTTREELDYSTLVQLTRFPHHQLDFDQMIPVYSKPHVTHSVAKCMHRFICYSIAITNDQVIYLLNKMAANKACFD